MSDNEIKTNNIWRQVFNAISDPAMILDMKHQIIEANLSVEKVTGLNSEEIVGRKCYEIFHGIKHPPDGCPHTKLLSSFQPETKEMEIETLGGTFLVSVSPIFDASGHPTRSIHLSKDITALKKSQENSIRKNRALKALSECNQVVVRARNTADLLHNVCKVLVEIAGYRLAWIGYALDDERKTVKPVASYGVDDNYVQTVDIVWSDTEKGRGPTGTAIRTGNPFVCRMMQTDPGFKPWLSNAAKYGYASSIALPLIDEEDKCIGSLNIYSPEPDAFDADEVKLLTDIANNLTYGIAAQKAQASLSFSEEKYRTLVETANDAIIIVQDEMIVFQNQRAETLTGYSKEELARTPFINFIIHDDQEETLERYLKKLSGERFSSAYAFRIKDKNNNEISVQVNTAVVTWKEKPALQCFIRDVTLQNKLETQLRQSQKLEAIGTLSGGIAHDFNNIIGIILGNTELAMFDVPDWSPAKKNLQTVRDACFRARDLVRQILSFSRQTEQKKQPIILGPIVKESLKLMRSSIPTIIEIRQNIKDISAIILADPSQINQVVINLCTNAAHAMKEKGGVIAVNMVETTLDEISARQYPGLSSGSYMKLTVSDTGHGIDPKILDRIFDPYFTTKKIGEGSGMGLAVVQGIVKNHGGAITVHSKLKKGTIFSILFPKLNIELIPEKKIKEKPPKGKERVLFVDDEITLAEIGQQMLEHLGYQAVSKINPLEVLELFKSNPNDFDLIISDMMMPQMTGDTLARRLIQIRPDIPIILNSGYSDQMDEEKAKEIGVKAYIIKPLDTMQLGKTIRSVLDNQ